jgi:hypothetical protein
MSRHDIPARDSKYTVVVGWDRPMRTYFAHVKDTTLDEDEEMVLWVGGLFDEVKTVEALAEAIEGYADLTLGMAATLVEDHNKGR